jgi:predicted secreted protein
MNRSKKLIVLANCILNANSKIVPLGSYPGVLKDVVQPYIDQGIGILQLPCPETSYLGMNRWGMSLEQYDHSRFREHCRKVLRPTMDTLKAFRDAGYEIVGVIGADGSPNCGITKIPVGLTGGEVGMWCADPDETKHCRFAQGTGVFMGIFKAMLTECGINPPFMAVDEENPSTLIQPK